MIKKGTNIYIRPLTAEDAEACLDLQNANRPFFEQFSMGVLYNRRTTEETSKFI
ncbi:hypothetical protein CHCC20348_3096 [Bacillus paralicheniformis]|nr:hypothetical protein CHCC20348_3096 [Bacillus paralicheniformis]